MEPPTTPPLEAALAPVKRELTQHQIDGIANRIPRHGILRPDVTKFRIGADDVTAALASLPVEQRVTLRWFEGYCRSKDIGKEEMGRLVKKANGKDYYSFDSLYQTLTGRRMKEGNTITAIVNAIENFKSIAEKREAQASSGFISTRLSRRIFAVCRAALIRKKIAFVIGDSQIGKTTTLREYQRQNNHGQTKFIDCPSGCTYSMFLHAVADEVGIISWRNLTDLKRALFRAIDDRMLIIFDNMHRAFRGTESKNLNIFDFIQELHEATGCGVVLSMTNEGLAQIRDGTSKKRLEQIWKRRITPLRLPLATPADDLELFASAFGLDPAPSTEVTIKLSYYDKTGEKKSQEFTAVPLELQTKVNNDEGLGVWINILQTAADLAQEAEHTLSWAHVLKAYCRDQADGEIFV